MKYHLSNRQTKELRNGKTLRIALPYPPAGIVEIDEDGLADWASGVLAVDVEHDIVLAELIPVPANPLERGGGGLGAVLGQIAHQPLPEWCVLVQCVVVELAARRAPRANYPTQWPAAVVLDGGRRIPEE